MKDYKTMWEQLEVDVAHDLSMLADPKTIIQFSDIQRMATAKLIQQSMIAIEKEVS